MKLLLMNGGGLDTLCVARVAREQYPDAQIRSLHLSYGLPSQERMARGAEAIADKYCDAHERLQLCSLGESGFVSASIATRPNAGPFIGVPYYGVLLITTGFSYAIHHDCRHVLTGLKRDAYRREFFSHLHRLLGSADIVRKLYRGRIPTLEAPLYDLPNDLVVHVIRDDPLIGVTWSCNHPVACGACIKCKTRAAFGIQSQEI